MEDDRQRLERFLRTSDFAIREYREGHHPDREWILEWLERARANVVTHLRELDDDAPADDADASEGAPAAP
jgi:hypothetical protein